MMEAVIGVGALAAFFLGIFLLFAWGDSREWGGLWFWTRRGIIRDGTAASAVILEERLNPSRFGSERITTFASEIILEVHAADRAPFEAVTRMIRTSGEGLYIAKGKTVPVRIGANGTVLIDLAAARRARQEADAASGESFEARAKAIENGRR